MHAASLGHCKSRRIQLRGNCEERQPWSSKVREPPATSLPTHNHNTDTIYGGRHDIQRIFSSELGMGVEARVRSKRRRNDKKDKEVWQKDFMLDRTISLEPTTTYTKQPQPQPTTLKTFQQKCKITGPRLGSVITIKATQSLRDHLPNEPHCEMWSSKLTQGDASNFEEI
ncbi:hypothetical protein AC579_51 [Pseudocercospora musae]|uniref:Uncharacterized protein n=1 Tax=Pseudocercospora musae TaxID=113226 RepID=A0A139IAH0_9PEZI|nr:hypothetical protein AC579_51 [Pseudocercospora musae]